MTMADENINQLLASFKDVDAYTHGHLPLTAAYCRSLQIATTINTLVPSEMQLPPVQVVTAMVLDVLSGRSPLYHVKDFLANQDIGLLLGEDLDAELFSDYTLGRSLDAIAAFGTGRIVTELGIKAVRQFQLDTSAVSFDTTSTSVWGEYEKDEEEAGPKIVHGHSKDNQAIQEALDQDAWSEAQLIQEIAPSPKRPPAQYKTFETTVEIDSMVYRAVIIHSSAHDKRRQKKVERQLESSQKTIEKKIRKLQTEFYCEADARYVVEEACKSKGELHIIRGEIHALEVRRRGRPPKNQPAPTMTRYHVTWTIEENKTAIDLLVNQAGCFVLITNVPGSDQDSLDGLGVLRVYKGQYGVEADFAFLKDPLVVNDLFLKTPARIDALGMVLVLALFVARLMEVHMRRYLDIHDQTVFGLNDIKTKNQPITQ